MSKRIVGSKNIFGIEKKFMYKKNLGFNPNKILVPPSARNRAKFGVLVGEGGSWDGSSIH